MSLQMLGRDCASPRILRGVIDNSREIKDVDEEIYDGCVSMVQHFQSICDQKKVGLLLHFALFYPGFGVKCVLLTCQY